MNRRDFFRRLGILSATLLPQPLLRLAGSVQKEVTDVSDIVFENSSDVAPDFSAGEFTLSLHTGEGVVVYSGYRDQVAQFSRLSDALSYADPEDVIELNGSWEQWDVDRHD
jgi:hypothetical protein